MTAEGEVSTALMPVVGECRSENGRDCSFARLVPEVNWIGKLVVRHRGGAVSAGVVALLD